MKLRHLFFALVAGAAALAACEQLPEDLGAPVIRIEPSSLDFAATAGDKDIAITATLNWSIKGDLPDWISLSATEGKASAEKQTVTVSVEANDSFNRSHDIVFSIGMSTATLTVNQDGEKGVFEAVQGDGSQASPYNVAQIAELVKDLTYDQDSKTGQEIGPFYIRGKVVSIKEAFSVDYGNATFNISDDGTAAGAQFTAYRVLYLQNKKWVEGNKQIAVGDVAVIYGKCMNYMGNTPENSKNSYLYSLNDETVATGGVEIDYSTVESKTIAEFIAAADTKTLYKITGEVTGTINSQFGNFDLKDDTGTVAIYGVENWADWKDKVAKGTTITIAGVFKDYNGKAEMVNGHILSAEGGQVATVGSASGTGTQDDPFNVAAAINVVKGLTYTDKENYQKVGPYYVAGKIASISEAYSAQYGNATFTIVDDGFTAEFTAFRILYLGNKKWAEGDTQIKEGDSVIIYAELMNYYGNTPETVQSGAYLYSLNDEVGEVQPEPEVTKAEPDGDGSEANPFNVSAAIDAVKDLTWTANDNYQKVGPYYVKGMVSSVKEYFGAEYGNAQFTMVDEGFTAEFTAYRILYLGGEKWTEGDAQIKAGDEVVVYAELMNYRGNTPETVQAGAYLFSLNGQTSIEQTDVFRVEKTELSVGAKATSAVINVIGNVAWTAGSQDAQVAPASGEGSAEVTVTFPANEDTENIKTYTVTLSTEADVEVKIIEVTILQGAASNGNAMVDVIDRAFTGVTNNQYSDWSGKAGTESPAVYAGQTAGGNDSVQLRSKNNNSGIISTTSGGKLKGVSIVWNSNTQAGRKLSIYGSNTAYTSPTDLYDTAKQGTLLGTFEYGKDTTELEFAGEYEYVGIRSAGEAMYLTSISIIWE